MREEMRTSSTNSHILSGGLQSPVLDSQTVFRTLMDAMAHPGKIAPLSPLAQPPAPLLPLSGAILLALADADTPIWLDKTLSNGGEVHDWLIFHNGAPFARECAEAAFAVVANPQAGMPRLEAFAQGSQDYPDRSTTLILQVESLSNDPFWRLSGPGIKSEVFLSVAPALDAFPVQWAMNHKRFPRGVDVILVSRDALVCLPRTTALMPCAPLANLQDQER